MACELGCRVPTRVRLQRGGGPEPQHGNVHTARPRTSELLWSNLLHVRLAQTVLHVPRQREGRPQPRTEGTDAFTTAQLCPQELSRPSIVTKHTIVKIIQDGLHAVSSSFLIRSERSQMPTCRCTGKTSCGSGSWDTGGIPL